MSQLRLREIRAFVASLGLVIAAPVILSPGRALAQTEAEAPPARDDSFADDDPRLPSFLKAMRLGEDSLLLGGYIQPGFTYVSDTEFNPDDQDGFEFNNVRLIGRGDKTIA